MQSFLGKRLTQSYLLSRSGAMINVPKRFEGGYPWFPSMAENIPRKNPRVADDTMDETEVITRMMHVLHRFHLYDLEKLDWKKSFGD